jgi:tetratricopeptide (TPR) repeat protein
MGQLGRNDPCRCGSGKKYKRCCLPADEAAEHAALRTAREAAEASASAEKKRTREEAADWKARRAAALEELDFIDASNAVVDLIHAGRLDEAERAAHELIVRYPNDTDGLARIGHVYEARGDAKTAAKHYREAVALARKLGTYEQQNLAPIEQLADRLDPL